MRYGADDPAPTWDDLEQAFRFTGSERLIAQRLRTFRAKAGLTQDELAKKLAELGAPIPQPSISKIEASAEAGKVGRDITVTEALALAKALDVTFSELLLPDHAIEDLHLYQLRDEGPRLYRAFVKARLDYQLTVNKMASVVADRPEWRESISRSLQEALDQQRGLEAQLSNEQLPSAVRNGFRPMIGAVEDYLAFLRDVIERADSKSGDQANEEQP